MWGNFDTNYLRLLFQVLMKKILVLATWNELLHLSKLFRNSTSDQLARK